MNRLTTERRVAIVSALVEGNSIRATSRMTGAAKGTILKLLADMGAACADYHDEYARDLTTLRVQCDEIWSFTYAKRKNVPADFAHRFGFGDTWTWIGMCADTKLVIGWRVGNRDARTGTEFMQDIADRLRNRVQLTTDGHRAYLMAVEEAFGSEIDYAMIQKLYGSAGGSGPESRYSPAKCIGIQEDVVNGKPDPKHVSTSYIERQNLTLRMSSRRFTRLTNAFAKKVANTQHAVSLHFMHYNYCRPHSSLKGLTPAQRIGIADHRWTLEELIGLLEEREESN